MPQPEPEVLLELERCVQIGLLCVQQSPDDRPTMSIVVTMLNNNGPQIHPPKKPVFDGIITSPLRGAVDHSVHETSSSSSFDSHTIYQTQEASNTSRGSHTIYLT